MTRKILSAALIFWLSVFSWAEAAPAPLYITQVQITGGKNNSQEDFVELFNPNTSAVDLKGYRLVSRSAESTGDSSIKVWTKPAIIPPKSFYLWANSGFTSIGIKPDVTTAAQISADSGIALRFGAADSGAIIASLAWGQSDNGFKNVSPANPGSGLSLERKNLGSANSAYNIGPSSPHNSTMTDLTAAFGQAVPLPAVPAPPLSPRPLPNPLSSNPGQSAANGQGNIAASSAPPDLSRIDNTPAPLVSDAPGGSSGNPYKYLAIAASSLVLLLILGILSRTRKT